MKNLRFITAILALTLFVSAAAPLPASVASAPTVMAAISNPVQAFANAAMGLPLLTPMSMAAIPAFSIAVESPTAGSTYACALLTQKPSSWTKMSPRQSFDMTWTIRNTGKPVWGKNGVDVSYLSGTKMHTGTSIFDMPRNVGSGRKISIIIDMVAPKTPGYYTTTWGLLTGSRSFCNLNVTVNVVK